MADSKIPKPGTDLGQDEVQDKVDEETEQGFRGTKADPTPNANYTVQGVLAGKPTPETQDPGTPGSTKSDPDTADGKKA